MGLVANLLILAPIATAAFLEAYAPDLYSQSSREDRWVEWASFWAFLAAGGVFVVGALQRRRTAGGVTWCFVALLLFCLAFALEEISWGQRAFGYRPPTLFLEQNFQQEMNFHNLFGARLRRLVFEGIVGGYGVLLPLLALLPPVARSLARAGVVTPPAALAPAFLLMVFTFAWRPLARWGEWVEFSLGLALLCVAMIRRRGSVVGTPSPQAGGRDPHVLVAASAIIVGLGFAGSGIPPVQDGFREERITRARIELQALRRDFLDQKISTKCGLQEHLYRFVRRHGQRSLGTGEFSRLEGRGMPEERVIFFLDPWDMPYRIRDRCRDDGKRRLVVVHSTGPNRRTDSTPWDIRGDDLGAVLRREGLSSQP
jgi:hypothetical protein